MSLIQTKKLSLASLLVFVSLAYLCQSASAVTGLSVSPGYIEASIPENGTAASSEITITNKFASSISMKPELHDAVERDGKIVPTEAISSRFTDIVKFDQQMYSIPAGEAAKVSVRFIDDPSLSPGGHYVAIVLRQATDATSEISLQAGISVMTYLVKEAGAVRSIDVAKVSAPQLAFFSLPKSTIVNLKNTGNVAVVARGSQSVVSRGKVLSSGVVNDGYVPLQPGTEQQLAVSLRAVGSQLIPARLRLVTTYRYEGSDQVATVERSIYFLPWQFFVLVLLTISGSVALIRLLNLRKRRRRQGSAPKPTRKLIVDVIPHKEA